MLDVVALQNLPAFQALSECGKRLVNIAIKESPVRQVRSGQRNVVQQFKSRKMGKVLDCESHSVEALFALQLEHDNTVLAYYLQPFWLDVIIYDDNQTSHGRARHCPDALVIRSDRIEAQEWKSKSAIRKLVKKHANRFIEEPGGIVRRPEIENHLKDSGIKYLIRVDSEINHILTENLSYLADYYLPNAKPVTPERAAELKLILQSEGYKYVAELIQRDGFTADEIYKAIADGIIAFDFENNRLATATRALVFPDTAAIEIHKLAVADTDSIISWYQVPQTIQEGASVLLDRSPFTITYMNELQAVLETPNGTQRILTLEILSNFQKAGNLQVISLGNERAKHEEKSRLTIADFSTEEREVALKRLQTIQGEKIPDFNPAARTIRKWKSLLRGVNPDDRIGALVALMPRHRFSGNRSQRLPDEVLEIMNDIIQRMYFNARNQTKLSCFSAVVDTCTSQNLTPPSHPTFLRAIQLHTCNSATRRRSGKRQANEEAPFSFYLEYHDLPEKFRESPHGSRPFGVVHIDHTQCDIQLKCLITGRVLGRPWLTIAMDAYTRHPLGFYLTFDPPSRMSVLMVLRDMVRRYGRLPATLVLDQGSDLRSGDVESVITFFGISRKWRPAGNPRFGAVMERLFGVTNTQFVHDLAGNTQVMKQARKTTKSINPKNLAEWHLESFYEILDAWLFSHYTNIDHPALLRTPAEAFAEGNLMAGAREHTRIPFDRTLRVITCPTPGRSGQRTVSKGRGIRLHEDFYYCRAFDHPDFWGKKVMIKYDPWDIRTCFAYIKGIWETCYSLHYQELANFTPRVIAAFTAELKASKDITRKNLSPERIVEHVRSTNLEDYSQNDLLKLTAAHVIYAPRFITTVNVELEDYKPEQGFGLEPKPIATRQTLDLPSDEADEEFKYDLFPD